MSLAWSRSGSDARARIRRGLCRNFALAEPTLYPVTPTVIHMKHKTALATAASVSGLLLASAAAMGANLGILQSGDQTFGSLSANGSTSTSGSTASLVPVVGQTPTSSTLPEGATIYQVPDVADITLVPTVDDGLQVLGVVTAPGWSSAVQPADTGIRIELTSATDTLEFKASLIDGRIQALVERVSTGSSDTVPATGSGRSVSGSTPSTVSTPTAAVSASGSTTNPGGTAYTVDDHSDDDHRDDDHRDDDHSDDDSDDHGGDDHPEYEGGGDDD